MFHRVPVLRLGHDPSQTKLSCHLQKWFINIIYVNCWTSIHTQVQLSFVTADNSFWKHCGTVSHGSFHKNIGYFWPSILGIFFAFNTSPLYSLCIYQRVKDKTTSCCRFLEFILLKDTGNWHRLQSSFARPLLWLFQKLGDLPCRSVNFSSLCYMFSHSIFSLTFSLVLR